MSLFLFLTSDDIDTNIYSSGDFTTKFESPIQLNGTWEIGLVRASCWYSFPNVSNTTYNNALIQYNNGAVDKQFTIPEGTYPVADLNTYIQNQITANGDVGGNITITPNYNTGKITVVIAGGYNLDLSVSNFYLLLGFSATQVALPIAVTTTGDNLADITNGVDNLYIRCSAVKGSYVGANNSDGIYAFLPDKPPHSSIDILPNTTTYVSLDENSLLDRIRMYITDQQGRLINFRGETTTYLLHLRQLTRERQ
jgi:hypothetical protein